MSEVRRGTMTPTKDKAEVLIQLESMATRIGTQYGDDLVAALRERSAMFGRLVTLGRAIDNWYQQKAAELLDENPSLSEWRFKIKMGVTVEGGLNRFRDQLSKTLELQCKNIQSEMTEIQSERKFTANA